MHKLATKSLETNAYTSKKNKHKPRRINTSPMRKLATYRVTFPTLFDRDNGHQNLKQQTTEYSSTSCKYNHAE